MMLRMIQTVAIAVLLTALGPVATAATPETTDLTKTFLAAGATVDRLQVYEIAGIVIIRGRAAGKAEAETLNQYAKTLGYCRVANLIQIVKHEDAAIARAAERELAVHRSLDGCQFSVTSDKGNLTVAGHVRHELQKDVAMAVLRSINGVRSVEVNLDRF